MHDQPNQRDGAPTPAEGTAQPLLLNRLRELLSLANEAANAGDAPAAGARCQEASDIVRQLGQLCQARPQLQDDAAPLFEQLKAMVDRVQRLQKSSGGQRRTTAAAAAAAAAAEAEEAAAAAAMDDNPFSERNVLQSFQMQQRQLEQTQNREAAMDKLAKDMIDLDEIFTELNRIVVEQGESLKLIDDHVTEVEVEVIKGEEQLSDAVKKQRGSRKKKIIIIVVVVAAVLVLALILYLVLSNVL